MNIILVLQLAKDGFDIHNWRFQTKDIDMHNVVHFRFSKKATHNRVAKVVTVHDDLLTQ